MDSTEGFEFILPGSPPSIIDPLGVSAEPKNGWGDSDATLVYYAISDLLGNLIPHCFHLQAYEVIHRFYCQETGYAGYGGCRSEGFWKAKVEEGYSLVEMKVPKPLLATVFPHKKVDFDFSKPSPLNLL